MDKVERKKQFDDMMSELQEIADLTNRSIQLQAEILDLLKSDEPDASEKIEKLWNECKILNKKITELKNTFDVKYPVVDKELELDDRIKQQRI